MERNLVLSLLINNEDTSSTTTIYSNLNESQLDEHLLTKTKNIKNLKVLGNNNLIIIY